MKKNLAIFLAMLVIFCNCTSRTENEPVKPDKMDRDQLPTTFEVKVAETLFPVYKDSMNSYQPGWPLPTFLYNYLLDYEYPWVTSHSVWSLRKQIFDSTKNVEALEAIINSKDSRLYKTINPDSINDSNASRIPFAKVSNHDLAKERLEELWRKP